MFLIFKKGVLPVQISLCRPEVPDSTALCASSGGYFPIRFTAWSCGITWDHLDAVPGHQTGWLFKTHVTFVQGGLILVLIFQIVYIHVHHISIRYIICHLSLRSISIKPSDIPTHGDISTCRFLQGKTSDIPDSIRAHQNEAFRIRRQILLAELPSGKVKLAMTGQLHRALLKRVVEGWNPSVDHHINHNTGLQFLLVVPKPGCTANIGIPRHRWNDTNKNVNLLEATGILLELVSDKIRKWSPTVYQTSWFNRRLADQFCWDLGASLKLEGALAPEVTSCWCPTTPRPLGQPCLGIMWKADSTCMKVTPGSGHS